MNLLKKIKNATTGMPSEELEFSDAASIIPDMHRQIANNIGIRSEIIAASDSSYLVSAAARICVGMEPVNEYEARIKHVERIMSRKHESTLEHTNIIILIRFDRSYDRYVVDNAGAFKYLNCHSTYHDGMTNLVIGGSIRGYKNFFRALDLGMENPVADEIKTCLYSCTEKVFYSDLIADQIMDETLFPIAVNPMENIKVRLESIGATETENGDVLAYGEPGDHALVHDKFADVLATEHRTFDYIYDKLSEYGFTKYDVMDLAVVTVIFKHISRPISMQINRHRNAISQESQRYVDYSQAAFVDPMKYIEEYDSNHRYAITLFGSSIELTSEELGNQLCDIYHQLLTQGMRKEEARSFLPSNVCTKLMMTFTYRNLYHFFSMREDKAAQPEVQAVAKSLHEAMRQYDEACSTNDELFAEACDAPKYKSNEITVMEEK